MSDQYAIFGRDESGRWVDSGFTLDRPIQTGEHEALWDLEAPAARCWREGKGGKWGPKPKGVEMGDG